MIVLSGGGFALRGHLVVSGEILVTSPWWGDAVGISWGKGQRCYKTFSSTRDSPPSRSAENYLTFSVSGA